MYSAKTPKTKEKVPTKRFLKPEKELTIEEIMTLEPVITDGMVVTFDGKKLLSKKLEEKDVFLPLIDFTDSAYRKMMALVDECDKEIAWHGVVETSKTGDTVEHKIIDILVYPQRITGTTVEAVEEKYAPWIMAIDDDTFAKIRLQGHSHVNMGVFASGPDEAYYQNLTEHMEDFYIILIANKRREFLVRYYDAVNNVIIDNMTFTVDGAKQDHTEWATSQIEEFIEKPAPYTYGSYSNYGTGGANRVGNTFQNKKESRPAPKNFAKETKKGKKEKTQDSNAVINVYFNEANSEVTTLKTTNCTLIGYATNNETAATLLERDSDIFQHITFFDERLNGRGNRKYSRIGVVEPSRIPELIAWNVPLDVFELTAIAQAADDNLFEQEARWYLTNTNFGSELVEETDTTTLEERQNTLRLLVHGGLYGL